MKRQRSLPIRIAGISLLLAVSFCVSLAWYGMRETVPPGLMLGDWAVEGLSLAEVERQLALKKELLLDQPVRLVSQQPDLPLPPLQWTMGQLGLDLPIQPVLDWLRPLNTGSPFQRAVYRWRLRHQAWPLAVELNADRLHETLLKGYSALFEKQPADAQRIIGPNDTVSYVPEAAVLRIDEAALQKGLKETVPSLQAAGTPMRSLQAAPLVNEAGLQGSGQPGKAASAVQAPAETDKPPLVLVLPFVKQEPKVTVQLLQAQGVDRKISEFTTAMPNNGEGRLHNVRSTAASIHDVLMKPGEVFDYAPFIATTEAKFGFKEAPVIVNGKLVPGIGGGICQVSTTLYNAVLRAGLDIVERRNHSLPVSYVPLGQDATFAGGHINFKFRNSTEAYLLIRTFSDEQRLTVKLFGRIPADLTYSIDSTTIETLQAPIKYVYNPALPLGREEQISEGKPGYVVETYRYKKQNGTVVHQERISRDTYQAQPAVIARNQGRPAEEKNDVKAAETLWVEDGIKGPVFP